MDHTTGTLELCEAIARWDESIWDAKRERERLVAIVEDRTGMTYDVFLDGMRRLLAPA